MFEGSHSLSNVVRLTEDSIDLATYQRLQKRLSDQIILVRKHLERNAEVSRDLAYLKLITFLVPLLISLRKKMLIPNLSQMLPPLSGLHFLLIAITAAPHKYVDALTLVNETFFFA